MDKEELEKEVTELRNEVKKLRKKVEGKEEREDLREESTATSRRQFLKKMAGGAAGLGAVSMLPSAAGFSVKSPNDFSFNGNGNKDFNIDTDGNISASSIDLGQGRIENLTGNGLSIDSGGNLTAAVSGGGFLISDDGNPIVNAPSDLNFGSNLSVADDGDGTVTIDAATGGGSSSDTSEIETKALVYKKDGTTYAEGPNGIIESGSSSAAIIENAVSNYRCVEVHGDYTLNNKITVTNGDRIIDAEDATFAAGGDNKLWEFDGVNNVRFSSGHLDLGSVGRIALDLKGVWNSHIDVYIRSVPDGTFSDGGASTDRCGIRVHRGDRGGSYWNTINVTSHWHSEETGIGMKINGGNANFFPSCKIMNYDVSIDIPDGSGNVFTCLDVSYSRIGVKQRAGKWGSFNDAFGMVWIEKCGTGFDVPAETNEWGDILNRFGIYGRYSTASDPDTTPFSDRDAMVVFDTWNGELLLGGMTLKNYELG